MSQGSSLKTGVQKLQEKISSFFRENILGILVLGIAAGVIAAYLYENGARLWNAVVNLLPFIAVLCVWGGAWLWDHGKARAELRRKDLALDNMSDALSFDNIVLILLAQFVSVPPTQRMNKLKEILKKLLDNAILAKVGNGGVFRASIFLPTESILNQLLPDALSADGNAPASQSASGSLPVTTRPNHEEDDYIKIWVSIGVEEDIIDDAKCYIGDREDIQRGFAGLAFKGTEPLIAHMIEQDGKWICKEYPKDYRQFEKYLIPRYRALAAAPIVTLGRTKRKTVGVICFDSMNPKLFDGEEARKALVTVGVRTGAIFSIYWRMVSAA
jgi:hypothetical protein